MKIDIYTHICPQKFIDAFDKQKVSWEKISGTARANGGPALSDVGKRLEVMDRYEDYAQVLVPSGQVLEAFLALRTRLILSKYSMTLSLR